MPREVLRARAEAKIFQTVVYDRKGNKRLIAVYMCGEDVLWADDIFGLFNQEKTARAPAWLVQQLKNPPGDMTDLDCVGNRLSVKAAAAALDGVPLGEGSFADTEDAIQQA